MKDVPAQFSLAAVFCLTAVVAVVAGMARVLPAKQLLLLYWEWREVKEEV